MFDVSGLSEIKIRKRNGWQGSYYVDGNDVCLAKTCSKCRVILSSDNFYAEAKAKYNLSTQCRDCIDDRISKRSKKLKNRSVDEIIRDRINIRPDGQKQCYKCRKTLPLDSFHISRSKIDGLKDTCTVCSEHSNLAPEQKSKANLLRSMYRKTLSLRSDEEIETDRSIANPSGSKECRNCKVIKPFNEFYTKRSQRDGLKDLCKPCDNKKSSDFRKKLYVDYWSQNGIPLECYVCGDPWSDADHVIADSRGGSDEPYNRLPICDPCNSSKWMNPLEEWVRKKYPDIADEVLYRVGVTYGVVY